MRLTPQGANQTELELADGTLVLFSYETPVACSMQGQCYRTVQYYSRTTSKHIGQFLARHGVTECDIKPQAFFNELTGEGR